MNANSIREILRSHALAGALLAPLVILCATGVMAAQDDVTDEKTESAAPEVQSAQDLPYSTSQTNTETEKQGSEQTVYPGVINKKLSLGAEGEPAVELYYPFFDNAPVDAAIRAFVEKQATGYEKEVKEGIEPDGEKPSSYGMWEMTGFYSLERPNPDIVSITFNIYSYSGGAHGNLVITCLNYNLKTGKGIDFADLFKDPEKALELMSKYSASRLKTELGEDADEDMILSGTAVDLNNFSNLTLIPSGLYIEFQPYQVGPWSIGPQRVEMTTDMLASAGPEPDIWPAAEKSSESGKPETK